MITQMLCSQHDKDILDQKGIEHYHYYNVRIAMVDHEKLSDLIAQSYSYVIQLACLTAIWGMQLAPCSLSKVLPFQIFCDSTLLLRSETLVTFLISQIFSHLMIQGHILMCQLISSALGCADCYYIMFIGYEPRSLDQTGCRIAIPTLFIRP